MGFTNSWLAIKNKTSSKVLSELNLKRTGDFEDFPESPITIAELPSNWLLLFTEFDHPSTQQKKSINSLEKLRDSSLHCRRECHVFIC